MSDSLDSRAELSSLLRKTGKYDDAAHFAELSLELSREALERPAPKDDDDESLLSSEAASPPRELSLDEQFYAAFPDKSAKNDEAEPAEDFARPRPASSYHRARVALDHQRPPRRRRGALAAVRARREHHAPRAESGRGDSRDAQDCAATRSTRSGWLARRYERLALLHCPCRARDDDALDH